MARLLLIDSNPQTSFILKRTLEKHHHHITIIASLKEAVTGQTPADFDIAIIDLKNNDHGEKGFGQKISALVTLTRLIVLSSSNDIKVGIELMKMGADDYLQKPVNSEGLATAIENLICTKVVCVDQLISSSAKPEIKLAYKFIAGTSASFRAVLNQVQKVSSTNYTVVIYGESGSGKEVVAQEIHRQSKRRNMPFIAIDCGALSKELASSDLFGHEKGAFTGAHSQKIGNFEVANGGTLFLDEVANLPYEVQVSLLRVVQERKFRRLGSTKDIEFDVRIIVATNEPLWDTTRKQPIRFREDLFHRLNEFTINVPPLRERREDIPFLAAHFLTFANQDLDKNILDFTTEVHQLFGNHFWYGNIRELGNTIRRAALLAEGNHIDIFSLPNEITNCRHESAFESSRQENKMLTPLLLNSLKKEEFKQPIKHVAIDAEYQLIVKVLAEVKFNKAKAARILNIDRKTLYNKLEEFTFTNPQL